MKEDTRSRIIRYAIAADLVIVATGIALFARSEPIALLALYVGAVTLAAWKGGWRAGGLAVMLSTTALLLFFAPAFDESHLIGFVVDGAIATAIMEAALPHRRPRPAAVPESKFGKLVAVAPLVDETEKEKESAKRREIARALERAAAEQLQKQRELAKVTPLTPRGEKRSDGSTSG